MRLGGEGAQVGDAVVAAPAVKTPGRIVSAASVVYPPADPPRIAIRAGSTRPLPARKRAHATTSSRSTMPQRPCSESRYRRP